METFETGEHITKYVEMGPGAPHNADLAELGSGAMLQMMLVDNLIHSDLHPGAASASRLCSAAETSLRDPLMCHSEVMPPSSVS